MVQLPQNRHAQQTLPPSLLYPLKMIFLPSLMISLPSCPNLHLQCRIFILINRFPHLNLPHVLICAVSNFRLLLDILRHNHDRIPLPRCNVFTVTNLVIFSVFAPFCLPRCPLFTALMIRPCAHPFTCRLILVNPVLRIPMNLSENIPTRPLFLRDLIRILNVPWCLHSTLSLPLCSVTTLNCLKMYLIPNVSLAIQKNTLGIPYHFTTDI